MNVAKSVGSSRKRTKARSMSLPFRSSSKKHILHRSTRGGKGADYGAKRDHKVGGRGWPTDHFGKSLW